MEPEMLRMSLAAISMMDSTLAHIQDADLSSAENRRLASMAHPRRRRQFLAGRLLSRRLLTETYGGNATGWTIAADPAGKPVIAGHTDIHLSISHSADYVACAIASVPVGVDVEYLVARRSTDELAQMVCNPQELSALIELSPLDKDQQFLELWTLKEAWLKRSGQALDISQMRDLQWISESAMNADAATWYFQHAGIAVSLVCAALTDIKSDWGQLAAPTRIVWRKLIT